MAPITMPTMAPVLRCDGEDVGPGGGRVGPGVEGALVEMDTGVVEKKGKRAVAGSGKNCQSVHL